MATFMERLTRQRAIKHEATKLVKDLIEASCRANGMYISDKPDDTGHDDFFIVYAGPRRSFTVKIMPNQETVNDCAEQAREELP
jgi:hypothetical protein